LRYVFGSLFLCGLVAALLRKKMGSMKMREPDWETTWETLLKEKPPDTSSAFVYKKKKEKIYKRNNLKSMAKLLLTSCLVPVVMSQGDKVLRQQVKGYLGCASMNKEIPEQLQGQVLQHLSQIHNGLLGTADDLTLLAVLDTGATHFSTPNQNDFINYKELIVVKKMGGIAGGLLIKGTGMVQYELIDRSGKIIVMEREAFHIPDLPVWLIPLQKIFPVGTSGFCKIGGRQVTCNFFSGQVVDAEIDPATNLPMIRVFHDAKLSVNCTHMLQRK